jgi:hypothetical protein
VSATSKQAQIMDSDFITITVGIGSAALGALLGSLSAFYLGHSQQKRDQDDKEYAALLSTQYALMSQWNILEGIRRQYLEERRNDPNRFIKLPLFQAPSHHYAIPFTGITFITQSKDPNLLQEIHIAEQAYLTSIDCLSILNQEKKAFYDNKNIHHETFDFETGVGKLIATPKDLFFVKEATNSLYSIVDKSIPTLDLTVKSVAKAIKSRWPKRRALSMTPIEPGANNEG